MTSSTGSPEAETGHKEKVKYEYDLANEQTKITYPNGKAVTRAYDNDARLEKITDWLGHTIKLSHDPDSNLATTTFPTTTVDEDNYTYNDDDQTTEVKLLKGTETLATLSYARDNDGQVQATSSKGLPGAEDIEDAYDVNNRLTNSGGAAYEYDAANNPTKLVGGTYKYNAADQLEGGPSLTYNYNELGERTKTTPTSGPATTYSYDEAGNLTTVERPKEGEVAKIEDAYAYNGEGLRASQDISGTSSYLTWDTTEELPLLLSDGTNSYIYGPAGLAVEQINNSTGTITYLHHDQAATTPLGFDGQYTNSDTGLVYLRAREYDPTTAQFMSVDPLVAVTREPYAYAGDNPLDRGDASGLCNAEFWTESFWTEGNCASESPLNPIPYYEQEISDYENGCGYLASASHGLEGAVAGATLFAGGEGEDEAAAAAEEGEPGLSWKTRPEPGADGGISEFGKETLDGEAISTVHRVHLEEELIHQHQTHIGKYGGERPFPNEWIQFPDVG